jgi:hypothetical protein
LRAEDPVRFGELDAALDARDDLRWLFYLECIHVPLEFCDDPNDRYVQAMVQRVAWFREFERTVRRPAVGRVDEGVAR